MNINTIILSLLMCLSGYQLKKFGEALDKIHVIDTSVEVMKAGDDHRNQQIAEVREKQKERDTQWANLEAAVSEIRIKLSNVPISTR